MSKQVWFYERLYHAIEDDEIDTVNILIKKGIDLGHVPYRQYPLSHAIILNRNKIVNILIKNGISIYGSGYIKRYDTDTNRLSTLYCAMYCNNIDAVNILINHKYTLKHFDIDIWLIEKLINNKYIEVLDIIKKRTIMEHRYLEFS